MSDRSPGRRQAGVTLTGFLLLAAVAALAGKLLLSLLPVYLDHFKVVAALESLQAQPDWPSRSREEVLATLQKRWEVDSVTYVTAPDVTISSEGRLTRVRIAYDVARPFIRNIELLVHFDDAIEAEPR